jgi:zinc protease
MTAPRPPLGRFGPSRLPSLAEEQLETGLHVIAVRQPSVPLVELRLVFPLSRRDITTAAPPLVLSESILAGTENHDRAGLAAALERFGGTLSAHVAGDLLVVNGSALAGSYRDLLGLLAEVLSGARYPKEEVEADCIRTADELSIALSRPETVAHDAFARRRFGRHPYATSLPRPETVASISAPALRRLHHRLIAPSGAHLVLLGDLQPRRAISAAAEALGPWTGAATAEGLPLLPPVPPVLPGGIDLVDRPGSVQSNLRLGGDAPDRAAPDWPALSLANQILGGMFTSRLVANLREKNGYTYSPHSRIDQSRAGATSMIGSAVATEVTAPALMETRYELARLATGGVEDDEAESARRYGVGSWLYRTATQAGLASTLAGLAGAGLGPAYVVDHPRRLARTTTREIDEAARRYFGPAGMATVVVGDAERVRSELAPLDEVRDVAG